jgi:hypothetical protein
VVAVHHPSFSRQLEPYRQIVPREGHGFIYALSDPRTDAIRYIGYTTRSLGYRLQGHIGESGPAGCQERNGTGRVRHLWIRELHGHGLIPAATVIDEVPDHEGKKRERELILQHLMDGCDLVNGDALSRQFRERNVVPDRIRGLTVKLFPEHYASLSRTACDIGLPLWVLASSLLAQSIDRMEGD